MDNKQLKEFMQAIGAMAETSLMFYRNILAAGGTPEEAMRLTQAFFAGILFGNKSGQENGGGVSREGGICVALLQLQHLLIPRRA